jgi:hypothetical protein
MVTTRSFIKDVPTTLTPVVVWIAPDPSGVLISLRSQSGSAITYKYQESSNGGATWTDKTFTVGEDTVTNFELAANAIHNAKITSSVQLRLVILGVDGSIEVSLHSSFADDPAEAFTIYPYPTA